jgi:hypothetical protein
MGCRLREDLDRVVLRLRHDTLILRLQLVTSLDLNDVCFPTISFLLYPNLCHEEQ